MSETEKNTPGTVPEESENEPVTKKDLKTAIAEAAAGSDVYTLLGLQPMREIKLRAPVTYREKEYTKLSFDFTKLHGEDVIRIIDELALQGVNVISPRYSDKFLIRALAKACTEKVGYEIFMSMWAPDYCACIATARLFF